MIESSDIENQLNQFMEQRFGKESFTPGIEKRRRIFETYISQIKTLGCRIISIAGTNGKGETALTLEKLFSLSNYSTALWTSPHILSICERFSFNGEIISGSELLKFFQQSWEELERIKVSLSYYEFLFLCFCKLSLKYKPDILILEVGLGGRLDTVNLLDADLSIITSISRDHQEILGNSYKEILLEKIAISRKNMPLITALETKYLCQICRQYSSDNNIKWYDLFSNDSTLINNSYSFRNQLLAMNVFYIFTNKYLLSEVNKLKALRNKLTEKTLFSYKARSEKMTLGTRSFIFIGAHNLDGIRKLTSCSISKPFDFTLISYSHRDNNEICTGISMYLRNSDKFGNVLLTNFTHPRAMDLDEIYNKLVHDNTVFFEKDWNKFFENDKYEHKTILVSGSYYFIGEFQKYLLNYSSLVTR
jgi:dihydrofolate synthase / folylpolyglutamate synthase